MPRGVADRRVEYWPDDDGMAWVAALLPTPATKTAPPGWTSPTGRHYNSEHQDWEPPHWPQQLAPEGLAGEPITPVRTGGLLN